MKHPFASELITVPPVNVSIIEPQGLEWWRRALEGKVGVLFIREWKMDFTATSKFCKVYVTVTVIRK